MWILLHMNFTGSFHKQVTRQYKVLTQNSCKLYAIVLFFFDIHRKNVMNILWGTIAHVKIYNLQLQEFFLQISGTEETNEEWWIQWVSETEKREGETQIWQAEIWRVGEWGLLQVLYSLGVLHGVWGWESLISVGYRTSSPQWAPNILKLCTND